MASRSKKNRNSVIAYLSHRRSTLYIAAKCRLEVAKKWHVESPDDDVWFLPKRGYTVEVEEVKGFVSEQVMEDREGDERIRKGYKCGVNHDESHKTCSFDSLSSYDYMGYSECSRGDPGDTCDEVYVKIGEYHDWAAACRYKYSDLPVYKWVCLP